MDSAGDFSPEKLSKRRGRSTKDNGVIPTTLLQGRVYLFLQDLLFRESLNMLMFTCPDKRRQEKQSFCMSISWGKHCKSSFQNGCIVGHFPVMECSTITAYATVNSFPEFRPRVILITHLQ